MFGDRACCTEQWNIRQTDSAAVGESLKEVD